jgi:hypothetical protein
MKEKVTFNKQKFNGANLFQYGEIWIPGACEKHNWFLRQIQ